HVGQVQSGRAAPPDGAGLEEHGAKKGEVAVDLLVRPEGKARAQERSRKALPVRDGDALAVLEGAGAALGGIQLATQGIPDDAGREPAPLARRDRDAPEGKAGDKVGCAVQGIDDPGAVLLRRAAAVVAAFFRQKRVSRKGLAD